MLAAAITAVALALELLQPGLFRAYLGPVPPVLGFVGCGVLAVWLPRRTPELRGVARDASPARALARLALWTLPFACSITAIDLAAPFPADINVPPPLSLLFYPSIAFVAEVVFHLLPLAVLLPLVRRSGDDACLPRALALAVVVLIEPTFQAVLGADAARPTWAHALTFLHILALDAFFVGLLVRRGLLAAYAQRTAYYAYWHVLYGALRLSWSS